MKIICKQDFSEENMENGIWGRGKVLSKLAILRVQSENIRQKQIPNQESRTEKSASLLYLVTYRFRNIQGKMDPQQWYIKKMLATHTFNFKYSSNILFHQVYPPWFFKFILIPLQIIQRIMTFFILFTFGRFRE